MVAPRPPQEVELAWSAGRKVAASQALSERAVKAFVPGVGAAVELGALAGAEPRHSRVGGPAN